MFNPNVALDPTQVTWAGGSSAPAHSAVIARLVGILHVAAPHPSLALAIIAAGLALCVATVACHVAGRDAR